MSESVSQSITVRAPVQRIAGIVTDLARYPEWQPEVREVEILETDQEGRARQARFVVDARIFTATYVLAYTYQPDAVSWRLVSSEQLRQLDGAYRFDDQGDGTTVVSYELTVDPAVPVPGFLRRRAAERIVQSALGGVRRRAEQPAT